MSEPNCVYCKNHDDCKYYPDLGKARIGEICKCYIKDPLPAAFDKAWEQYISGNCQVLSQRQAGQAMWQARGKATAEAIAAEVDGKLYSANSDDIIHAQGMNHAAYINNELDAKG